MKILYVTTIGSTMNFFKSFIKQLLDDGHTVDVATNESISAVPECYKEWGCNIYQIDTSRSPLDKGNLFAVKQIKTLVEKENYGIVHCHTPIAAMCTRIACWKVRKNGTKVFYTAHGFHFFKGAPLKNWLIYYPIEKFCSYFTDVLITINQEDYALAKRKLKAKWVVYVPGVGVDVKFFAETMVDTLAKRDELRVPQDAFLLLSVGELNENKNHVSVVKAVAELKDKKIHYLIAGGGGLWNHLIELSKELKVEEQIHLLGRRSDVAELCKVADIYVHPSFREGLPVAVMEAMASGLPCVVSQIRGNVDLIEDGKGGYLCPSTDADAFAEAIKTIANSEELRQQMREYNLERIKEFDISVVEKEIRGIYEEVLGE